MTSRLRIIVTGLIAQHPTLGGVAWDYLQYVLGLARLGHDVYYIEDSGQWPYKTKGGPAREDWIAHDCSANVDHLAGIMERYGLHDRWAYHFPVRSRWYGLSRTQRRDVLASAELLINVSGTLKRPSDYREIPRLVYIDSDPVFTQVKLKLPRGQLKFQKRVEAHDLYFSFGERPSAEVPETGHQWRPTRQPIVLSEWRPSSPRGDFFTTVMSWTSYRPLRFAGRSYTQKDAEFLRFLDLPRRVAPTRLEVALGGIQHVDWETKEGLPDEAHSWLPDEKEWTPRELLAHAGFGVVDPMEQCSTLDRYRDFVESSKAEWTVAKGGYVVGQSGWFSCRSACYLAAGRPVVVQDTGLESVLPLGEGILAFTSPGEAAAAIREVEGNYGRHARSARAIAEEYFDSGSVLSRLIEEAMASDVGCTAAVGSAGD